MLASKRTATSLPATGPGAAAGAHRRAVEAGHLAEQPVERDAGEGEADHRQHQQGGEGGGAAVAAGEVGHSSMPILAMVIA